MLYSRYFMTICLCEPLFSLFDLKSIIYCTCAYDTIVHTMHEAQKYYIRLPNGGCLSVWIFACGRRVTALLLYMQALAHAYADGHNSGEDIRIEWPQTIWTNKITTISWPLRIEQRAKYMRTKRRNDQRNWLYYIWCWTIVFICLVFLYRRRREKKWFTFWACIRDIRVDLSNVYS